MRKTEIIQRLEELNFDPNQYWVITGGAMVLYGIREETGDVALGCTSDLADTLEAQGYPVSVQQDGTRKLTIGEDVEIFENWLYDSVQLVEGFPVISLEGLVEMKQHLGREKDFRDIRLIERYLSASES